MLPPTGTCSCSATVPCAVSTSSTSGRRWFPARLAARRRSVEDADGGLSCGSSMSADRPPMRRPGAARDAVRAVRRRDGWRDGDVHADSLLTAAWSSTRSPPTPRSDELRPWLRQRVDALRERIAHPLPGPADGVGSWPVATRNGRRTRPGDPISPSAVDTLSLPARVPGAVSSRGSRERRGPVTTTGPARARPPPSRAPDGSCRDAVPRRGRAGRRALDLRCDSRATLHDMPVAAEVDDSRATSSSGHGSTGARCCSWRRGGSTPSGCATACSMPVTYKTGRFESDRVADHPEARPLRRGGRSAWPAAPGELRVPGRRDHRRSATVRA